MPLQQDQHTYRSGVSIEAALFPVINRLKKVLAHKVVAPGPFLDIQGAFNNTPVVGGSNPSLEAD